MNFDHGTRKPFKEPLEPLGEVEPIKLICQLGRISTSKDGSVKIQFEAGAESLEGVHQLQLLNGRGEVNFMVVCAPFRE